LPIFVDLVQGIEGVGEFRFGEEDIVRSKILKEIVRRYEQWKYKLVGGTGNQRPK
jgi:phosphate starvation-inducible protein PhoH